MTKILMSFQPKWVAKILDGEKLFEVRKHQFKTGDEIYMYCTKDRKHSYAVCEYQKGKVVAKYVVGDVIESTAVHIGQYATELRKKACVIVEELIPYVGGFDKTNKPLYFHEITNLQIFDKPKELGEFKRIRDYDLHDGIYKEPIYETITKAPRNFIYVEESG